MNLSVAEVNKVAELAKLTVSENETRAYCEALSRILELVEQINAVDVSDTEPMAHPIESPQRLRADRVSEHDERETFQAVAPDASDGFYLVPKVIASR